MMILPLNVRCVMKHHYRMSAKVRVIIHRCLYSKPPMRYEMPKSYRNTMLYATAGAVFMFGMCWAAIPLYRIYCQSTGKGGKPFLDAKSEKRILEMTKDVRRHLTVTFNADTVAHMAWEFKPTQKQVMLSPGETTLAFFTAKNTLDIPVTGISTYTVQPYEAGQYLNKIQCFCFEEQRLNPNEEVDMPVFFYIDPEYSLDPRLERVNDIILSYTFFPAKDYNYERTLQGKAVNILPKFEIN